MTLEIFSSVSHHFSGRFAKIPNSQHHSGSEIKPPNSRRRTCSKTLLWTSLTLLCVHRQFRQGFRAGLCKNHSQPKQCLSIYANSTKFPFVSLSSTRKFKTLPLLTNTLATWPKQKLTPSKKPQCAHRIKYVECLCPS